MKFVKDLNLNMVSKDSGLYAEQIFWHNLDADKNKKIETGSITKMIYYWLEIRSFIFI